MKRNLTFLVAMGFVLVLTLSACGPSGLAPSGAAGAGEPTQTPGPGGLRFSFGTPMPTPPPPPALPTATSVPSMHTPPAPARTPQIPANPPTKPSVENHEVPASSDSEGPQSPEEEAAFWRAELGADFDESTATGEGCEGIAGLKEKVIEALKAKYPNLTRGIISLALDNLARAKGWCPYYPVAWDKLAASLTSVEVIKNQAQTYIKNANPYGCWTYEAGEELYDTPFLSIVGGLPDSSKDAVGGPGR